MEPRSLGAEPADRRRRELADFLRTRRIALAPESVGLEPGPRRRTPGLRREEVAERAGISVALYTWLEQGREVPVSARTIDAVANALALTTGERLHVHRLTQRIEALAEVLTPALTRLVEATRASAMLVLDHRFDVVLENLAASALFSHDEDTKTNVLDSVLLDPKLHALFVDWPSVAAFVVANFRIDYALHAEEPATVALVARLERESPAFVGLWRQHDAVLHPEGARDVVHPQAGPMTMETTLLTSVESPGLRVMAFTPVDPASSATFATLVAGSGAAPAARSRTAEVTPNDVDNRTCVRYYRGPMSPSAPSLDSSEAKRARFGALRAALATRHREAAPAAFVTVPAAIAPPAEASSGEPLAEAAHGGVLASGLGTLDAALGGGFPSGAISTLEGGAGASAVALRLLALGTARGLAALVELPAGAGGRILPAALAAAGVDLTRLLVVAADDAAGVARAVDIVLRSGAFGVVVMPPVTLAQAAWTRLASLTHRADCVLLATGGTASPELRFFASLRVRLRPARVRWSGGTGIFATLAGIDVEATVMKHKRAAPGRTATFACATFEPGPHARAERERELRAPERVRLTPLVERAG